MNFARLHITNSHALATCLQRSLWCVLPKPELLGLPVVDLPESGAGHTWASGATMMFVGTSRETNASIGKGLYGRS